MPIAFASMNDPESKEYKRARRLHEKTTRGRSERVEADWSPFRAVEKKYKAKFPPPDLSAVLDLALLDERRTAEINKGKWKGSVDAVEYKLLEPTCVHRSGEGTGKAYIFPQVPGASEQYLLYDKYVFTLLFVDNIRSCHSSVLHLS
jgi:alkylated DNA repair protein alkB homolog 1